MESSVCEFKSTGEKNAVYRVGALQWYDFFNRLACNNHHPMENFPQYRVISGLSYLIRTHSKRIKHYTDVALKVRNSALKSLFKKYAAASEASLRELVPCLVRYGGPSYFPLDLTELNSFWSKVSHFFYSGEADDLLFKSEAIERYSVRIHRKALASSVIPSDTVAFVEQQIRDSESALRIIKMLQEKGVYETLVA